MKPTQRSLPRRVYHLSPARVLPLVIVWVGVLGGLYFVLIDSATATPDDVRDAVLAGLAITAALD